jgi:hypothetical protein
VPRIAAAVPMKPLALVAEFNPPAFEEFHIIELLHAPGEITTPTVPNYADLSATWAMVRYIWAFDRALGAIAEPLRLSTTARALDFHQKTLLSDQMGVAFAALIMNRRFAMPNAVDVSIAVKDPAWCLHHESRRSPDYLFHRDPIQGPVFVVECKGNQTSFAESVHQLQSGSEQVHSLTFTNGRQSTAFVIATYLQNDCEVFVIDPPPGKPPPPTPDFGDSKAYESRPREWTVTDPQKFARELARIRSAKLLSFAGDFNGAFRVLGVTMPSAQREFLQTRGRPAVRENEFGTFQGKTFQISLPDGTPLKAFRGILRELRLASVADPEGASHDSSPINIDRGITITETLRRRRTTTVASVSASGTTLELSIG